MPNCVFCKIIAGEIPSFKVFEDNDFVAILDINPNTKGVTLVMPKKHHESDLVETEDAFLENIVGVSRKVAQNLKAALGVKRVGLIVEGMGVDHFHVKLYPFHGLGEDFKTMAHGTETVFFEKYPGYMTSLLGPPADFEELRGLADEVRDEGS